MPDPANKRHRPVRNAVERLLTLMLLGGRVAAWSHRVGLHGKLRVVHHEIALRQPGLLPRPLTIGFASDFHAGPTTHPALVDELGEQLRQSNPDVLLLGGDYVSFDARHVDRLRRFVSESRAPLGTYAVIGNHDIWNGREPIEAALRQAGAQVLVNRNVRLPAPFDMVSICGIDDPWTGEADAARTFAGAGAVRVFLMHSPDGLWHLDGETFDLALAGHTHGGQVALADGRPVVRPKGPLSRRYCYGRFSVPDNGALLVSRGVGCSALPLRVNADPELVLCTLR
jgi:predicted MPP superfamily phosphohydrolase